MEEIVNLLNEKNSCLARFYNLNEREMQNFVEGNFENLEEFYATREGILNMITRVDEMIDMASLSFEEDMSVQPEISKQISDAVRARTEIIERILEQDLEILSTLDRMKSEIIKDLSQTKMTRKAVGSYKSGQKRQKIDEEY